MLRFAAKLTVLGVLAMMTIGFGHYVGYLRGALLFSPSAPGLLTDPQATAIDDEAYGAYGDGADDLALLDPLPRPINPALDWREQALRGFAKQNLPPPAFPTTEPTSLATTALDAAATTPTAPVTPQAEPLRRVALVIDDVGLSFTTAQRAIALDAPLTIALLPYARQLQRTAELAHEAGHDILVHVPMEPLNAELETGRMALLTSLSDDDILARLHWNLGQFGGYVGVNNHMGSMATADPRVMAIVMREMQRRSLMFLDSRTGYGTGRVKAAAQKYDVPLLTRDIFIDDEATTENVAKMLKQIERLTRRQGDVVAIAHPLAVTLGMLEVWIPEARARGIAFVTISQMAALTHPERLWRDDHDEVPSTALVEALSKAREVDPFDPFDPFDTFDAFESHTGERSHSDPHPPTTLKPVKMPTPRPSDEVSATVLRNSRVADEVEVGGFVAGVRARPRAYNVGSEANLWRQREEGQARYRISKQGVGRDGQGSWSNVDARAFEAPPPKVAPATTLVERSDVTGSDVTGGDVTGLAQDDPLR